MQRFAGSWGVYRRKYEESTLHALKTPAPAQSQKHVALPPLHREPMATPWAAALTE